MNKTGCVFGCLFLIIALLLFIKLLILLVGVKIALLILGISFFLVIGIILLIWSW